MDYARNKSPKGMPSLSNMTQKAIELLHNNPEGYLLVVEGGLIDYAHHRGHARQALDETVSFSDAIRVALEKTDPQETLIVVTSDHSHSLVFTGYLSRGSNVLGKCTNFTINGGCHFFTSMEFSFITITLSFLSDFFCKFLFINLMDSKTKAERVLSI